MYPTKKEILENPPRLNSETIEKILLWKKGYMSNKWKTLQNEEKIKRLNILIYWIQIAENTGIQPSKNRTGKEYKYSQRTQTIYHSKTNPSIISSLHELAHHLFGRNELNACRWSVHLFKICFPSSYQKLKWSNHLLIK